jgi:heme/copper-type cytochrome/quinol oxidase subunit 2
MYNKLLGHFLSPSMAILRKKFTTMPKSIQRLIFIIIVVVIGMISYAVVSTIRSLAQQQKAAEVSQSKKYTGAGLQAPDYTTILPVGKTIESLGGWTRVSPTNRNPVFAFIDTIDGKQIFVNQQPLPPVFIDKMGNQDESQIAQLTQGNTKNDKITVGQTTVYIGTSAKGPQSVIFGKNNLLVLIKSSVAITNDQWARYVNSLK